MVTHRSEQPLPDRLLERIYPMPRPTLTHEEYQRARHLDLPALEATDLDAEAFRVMSRLAREHDSLRREWLSARRQAIRGEQARRRQTDRPAKTPATPVPERRPLMPIRGGDRRGR
ncbi:MAG TPA: hypothetical protein VGR16_14840 [Thermomicrobiales bacterium]|nr:hypothetical protein [Thermomicrobiales bacterium]